jgi:hypothetical protein
MWIHIDIRHLKVLQHHAKLSTNSIYYSRINVFRKNWPTSAKNVAHPIRPADGSHRLMWWVNSNRRRHVGPQPPPCENDKWVTRVRVARATPSLDSFGRLSLRSVPARVAPSVAFTSSLSLSSLLLSPALKKHRHRKWAPPSLSLPSGPPPPVPPLCGWGWCYWARPVLTFRALSG